MLTIPQSLLNAIHSHAEQTYPHECSGLMVGDYENRRVKRTVAARNVHTESTRNRYLIDPREYIKVEAEARKERLDVIGVYHSHPDAPAKPSQYDAEHAWPSYTYVIVSVVKGKVDHARAWVLRDDRSGFEEEQLSVIG